MVGNLIEVDDHEYLSSAIAVMMMVMMLLLVAKHQQELGDMVSTPHPPVGGRDIWKGRTDELLGLEAISLSLNGGKA